MALPSYLECVGPGVYAIDTGFARPRFDAAYLVVDGRHAAFVDTGHNAAVPRLLGALDALGIERSGVEWVIATHVHLDHAGGLGCLMNELPSARVWAHPRGARHLIDPSALMAGARAVYGEEEVERTYGELQPVPADRVVASADEMTVQVGSRQLLAIDTPGHARHHHCIWDETSLGWFTGDTFGIAYPEFVGTVPGVDGPFIFPSSTPVQFEPAAMRASINRMLERSPACIYPTHFSRQDRPERLARQLFNQLDVIEAGARAIAGRTTADTPERNSALRNLVRQTLLDAARVAGSPLDEDTATALLDTDIELNAQGLAVWLEKSAP